MGFPIDLAQPNSSALGASSSQRQVPAGPGRDVQPVHSRLDQLLQPLLQDAVASDLEGDRSLCHPLGAPKAQAVASEAQGCESAPKQDSTSDSPQLLDTLKDILFRMGSRSAPIRTPYFWCFSRQFQ